MSGRGRGRKTLEAGVDFKEGTALAAQAYKAADAEKLAPYVAAAQRERVAYALVHSAYCREKAEQEVRLSGQGVECSLVCKSFPQEALTAIALLSGTYQEGHSSDDCIG